MEKIIHGILTIFSVTVIRYFVLAGVPFFLFYKLLNKWYGKAKIQSRDAGLSDFKREILQSVQTTGVFAVIAFAVMYTPFRNYTQLYSSLTDFPLWYLPVSLVPSLIIHDTYFYWMHRFLHHKKLFRLTHLVHHQSTNPSPWASYSFHFLESCTEGFVLVVIVMLIPIHPVVVIWFTIVGFIINVYGHLGYEIAPRWLRGSFLFQVINTSVHHNLHHSKFKGNYGLYFRVWDRLMKTEHPDYVKEYDRIQANRFKAPVNVSQEKQTQANAAALNSK
ncbi:sterol desaturase family protein [Mucilaginibacter pallidiroseus]|uniref:Sterol desaturase family protein n=1 Tax=Mucilaginibacter pallidiroseus TaxID=2599295 RepID=A0A563UI77_9SPHI|nr:sterol desaturase family protein [Mucilaginibacter pallidiroseus]TWR31065.1 sterol desaturase family protein [Mucilaginibacter pallidiroseus]